MSGKRIKVLVVDDDPGILEAMKFMLDSSGYDVATESRGDEVIACVRQTKPDIILLDLYLSGFDGRDIAMDLKKDEGSRHIPIIMISAHPTAGESVKGSLVDDFLPKPFDVKQLLDMIEEHAATIRGGEGELASA